MKRTKILTTTIGSFPKPKYLPIIDWFDSARGEDGMNTVKTTIEYSLYNKNKKKSDEELFKRAASEIIKIQLDAGIDIPTDGEIRRENYIHYHCRHLDGFDFDKLEHRVLRDGAYSTSLPAIRSKIKHTGKYYSPNDYIASQSLSRKPIKFTIPGPLTIMDTTADCYYNDRKKLSNDLADTINQEIRHLVEMGCSHIQIDEPLFARQVDDAFSFGFEGIERCFYKVPKDINKIIHICCGYTDHLDDENYKKADPKSYFQLSNELNNMSINQISIEDAHFKNDLSLLTKFPNKKIIFGAINVTKSRLESIDEIVERLTQVLNFIDRDRLIISPDCGMGLFSLKLAEDKLNVMCNAVKLL